MVNKSLKVLPVDKEFLTNKEAMAYMGCSEDYLSDLRKNGQVAYAQEGRMIWYPIRTLRNFIMRHMVINEKGTIV